MPSSPFYNQSSGSRSSGPGVSSDGYDGAQNLFKSVKSIAGELHLMPQFDMNASARAAADAYMACRNGLVSPQDALFHESDIHHDFPQPNLDQTVQNPTASSDVGHLQNSTRPLSGLGHSLSETGHSLDQLMPNLGQMIENAFSGPAGIVGSMIRFISELFSSIAKTAGQALTEFANEAESVAEETWKK